VFGYEGRRKSYSIHGFLAMGYDEKNLFFVYTNEFERMRLND